MVQGMLQVGVNLVRWRRGWRRVGVGLSDIADGDSDADCDSVSLKIMGIVIKLVDAILFFFFVFIALAAPLLDSQTVLPSHLFPTVFTDLKSYYATHYDDYLVVEKPHFFIGLIWVDLLLQWPLALASLYAIVTGKSWLPTTCLIYGASTFTSMVTILLDMTRSGKASEKLLAMYFPFLGFAILAILRGLLPHSNKTNGMGKRSALIRKKRA